MTSNVTTSNAWTFALPNSTVTIPVTLPWNIALVATHAPLVIFMAVNWGLFRRSVRFAIGPWVGFEILRWIEYVLGFNIRGICTTSPSFTTAEAMFITLTAVWDFGLYLIIYGLIKALGLSLSISSNRTFSYACLIWKWLVGLMLAAGYSTGASAIIPPRENQSPNPMLPGLATASWVLLGVAVAIEALTVLMLLPTYIFVLINRRPGQPRSSSTACAIAWVALPSLVLLVVRLISDALRMWNFHIPGFPELIGTGLVPEILVTAFFLAVGYLIARSDKRRREEQAGVVEMANARWRRSIKEAYDLSLPKRTETKGELIERIVGTKVFLEDKDVFSGSCLQFLQALLDSLQGRDPVPVRRGKPDYDQLQHRLDASRNALEAEVDIVCNNMAMEWSDADSLLKHANGQVSLVHTVVNVEKKLSTFVRRDGITLERMARQVTGFFLRDLDYRIDSREGRGTNIAIDDIERTISMLIAERRRTM